MAIPCVAEPEEITRLVLFVASDEASFSTGSEFIVDGGVRWDPCRSMNAPTRPWPASFRITSCHPCGTSVTLGPIPTWRTAGPLGGTSGSRQAIHTQADLPNQEQESENRPATLTDR